MNPFLDQTEDKSKVDKAIATVEKVIRLNKEDMIINNVYLNPLFADLLINKVPELKELGVSISKTETETDRGRIVSSKINTQKDEYDLGSVLLDGENVRVLKSLSTGDELIGFLKYELEQTEI